MGYPSNSSGSKETQIQPFPDFQAKRTLPFILHLRCVCETIFDVMLSAYIPGLEAYHKRSKVNGEKQGWKRPNLDGWDRALKSAEDALAMSRKAEDERRGGDVHSPNTTLEEALLTPKDRYRFHSSVPPIISYSVSVQEQFRLCTIRSSS